MKKLILAAALIMVGLCATAQKKWVIGTTAKNEIYYKDSLPFTPAPGDTLYLPPVVGGYVSIVLAGFHGTPDKPIIVTSDGMVANWIRFDKAYYFKLVCAPGAMKFGAAGVSVGLDMELVHDVVIDGPEVSLSEVGIAVKKNPDATDPLTIYPNWVIANVEIMHTYIHNTIGEGMYIGHTYPSGDPYHGGLVPIRMSNVKIHHNRVEHTGWDGIQLSNAQDNCEIYENDVLDYGTADVGSQRAGIILGANTTGSIHNNRVTYGTGNGIQVFGYDHIYVYSNTVTDAGKTKDPTANGLGEQVVFTKAQLNIETRPKQVIVIADNLFVNPMPKGVLQTNNDANYSDSCYFMNNRVQFPGTFPANWTNSMVSISQPFKVVNGNTGFNIQALPLNFLSFLITVLSGGDLSLSWSTADEVQVDHYEVEESDDGINFHTVDSVPADNTAGQHQYIKTVIWQ